MTKKVRVRFPPSPTGELHVGNVQTAIFNWLFARGSGGDFIIRIEDTDQARKVEGAVETMLESLRWLRLDWDEGPDVGGEHGPYVQSQRLELYERAAEGLVEDGRAYRCFCTPERLAEMRKEQERLKRSPGYDGRCSELSTVQGQERLAAGEKCVVRFAMPKEGVTKVSDLIRGEITYENRLIDDFVMLKSDGFPTYHLAHVVDDHAMEISHVLRGEDWLPSAPRHLRIYEALGWEPPQLAHLPIILAPDRSKLSKRHGATSTLEFRELGYLPGAMVNFLALLGWSLDDKTEVLSVPELIESFSLEGLSRSAAIFNLDKLNWLNGYYIRQMTDDELADALLDYWGRYPPKEVPELPDKAYLLRIVPLVQERLKTLSDAAPLVPFFFQPEAAYETADLVQKGMDADGTRGAMEKAHAALEGLSTFDAEAMEGALRPLAEKMGMKVGQLFGSLRIATTGLQVSPPLFQTMEVLGRERSLDAIREAARRL